MGWGDNAERDRIARANVQRLRDERDRQTRADWHTSEQAENIRKIQANAAARKAAQSGSCMMARTTLTMLALSVAVLKSMSSTMEPDGDGCGDDKWRTQAERHPGGRTCED